MLDCQKWTVFQYQAHEPPAIIHVSCMKHTLEKYADARLHFINYQDARKRQSASTFFPSLKPTQQHCWRCMGWIWENREKSKERQNESVTMSCKSKTSIFISSYYSRFNNCYVVGYKLNLLKDFSSPFKGAEHGAPTCAGTEDLK